VVFKEAGAFGGRSMKKVVWCVVVVSVVAGAAAASAVSSGEAMRAVGARNPMIEIWKSRHEMQLRDGGQVMKRFQVALGIQPKAPKRMRGDLRTPVGRYYISEKRPSQQFYRFLGISYPNVVDADRGYKDRLIDARQWGVIFLANLRGDNPTWRTPLGGMVGIHGYGARPHIVVDWTEGCIAVGNDEIEVLYDTVSVGTPVLIHE
jgi:murein L,D-transpeptidase YafK